MRRKRDIPMDIVIPDGYRLRALGPEDEDAAIGVEVACETATDGSPDPAMVDGVRQTWGMPGYDRERDSWAVVAPGGQLAGFAHLGPPDRSHLYDGPHFEPIGQTTWPETMHN